jgi:nitroimidazol reductase NimA-like FMN-containing flavoprotein (pyridoxamine 5'-phosphate oxidase superfamily)
MRRKEKEMTNQSEIEAVIGKATVCRLAMADENGPYIVPLCFGFSNNALYFHSAKEGKKLDILNKNNQVCFEFDVGQEITSRGKDACDWGMKYQSVIGYGKAVILQDSAAKRQALDIIMGHYAEGCFAYHDSIIDKTTIIKIEIERMTGKQSI